MNISKLTLVVSVFLQLSFFASSLLAQQASGLHYENYAGIHGVVKNPAYGKHGKLGWDVNLASINLYGRTTYASVSNANLFSFVNSMDSLSVLGINEQQLDPAARGIFFDDTDRNRSAYLHADVMGPSVWIDLQPVALGVFVRGRAQAGISSIPQDLGYHNYQNLMLDQEQSIDGAQSAGAAWTEYGINVSSSLVGFEHISFGINVKYLQGHEGYYLNSPNNIDFTKTSDEQLVINSAVSTLAYTSGLGDISELSRSNRGAGWSLDVGYSQLFERSRLGISLLDLGRISFNSNAEMHRIVINEPVSLAIADIVNSNNLNGLISLVDQSIGDTTLISNDFSVGTPARIIVNYDYQLARNIYVNSSLSQSVTSAENAIRSENNVSISPRFESRWFTVAVPVVINNYESVHVGFATRLGVLTIGSDHVMSLFGNSEFNGSSIFAAVKINPWGQGNRGRGVNCPKVKRSPWDSATPIAGARRMRSPG